MDGSNFKHDGILARGFFQSLYEILKESNRTYQGIKL